MSHGERQQHWGYWRYSSVPKHLKYWDAGDNYFFYVGVVLFKKKEKKKIAWQTESKFKVLFFTGNSIVNFSWRWMKYLFIHPSIYCRWLMISPVRLHHHTPPFTGGRGCPQTLTLAGVWIQMAALNRMWSHSCFSSGAPCVRPSRYLAKERNCSSTEPVTCTREDWRREEHTIRQWKVRKRGINKK